MKLEESVIKAIKENLPGATASILKDFISEKEKVDDDLLYLKGIVEKQEKTIKTLQEYKSISEGFDSKAKDLMLFEKELQEKSVELRIKEAVLAEKEFSFDERIGDFRFMFETVFRNSVVKTEVLKNRLVKQPGYTVGDYNNPVPVDGGECLAPDPVAKTETTE